MSEQTAIAVVQQYAYDLKGVELDERAASWILWEKTGWPEFFAPPKRGKTWFDEMIKQIKVAVRKHVERGER